MTENSYLLWDVSAEMGSTQVVCRVIAHTEIDALEKSERLVPCRQFYKVLQVQELWMPGVQLNDMVKALEKHAPDKDGM